MSKQLVNRKDYKVIKMLLSPNLWKCDLSLVYFGEAIVVQSSWTNFVIFYRKIHYRQKTKKQILCPGPLSH